MVLGNMVVRKIFGYKRERKLRKAAINLRNNKLYDRYSASNILIIKPIRCTNFSNLFLELNSTCFGRSSVHHQEFSTVHTAMVCVIQVC